MATWTQDYKSFAKAVNKYTCYAHLISQHKDCTDQIPQP